MARSCGIRIGPRRFELVVLEGSPRKHRIVAFTTGEYLAGDEGDAGEALEDAVRAHGVPLDNVSIAVDSGLAAFRSLRLPMTDDAKIEEVLKFEIESELPQWNIDDVIVDFLVQQRDEKSSELLVTALRKEDLRGVLDVCADAGFEPQEAEIEATAMLNAAMTADICHADDAQILVHIGEASTAVCVVDGGRVKSIRAIHIGALSHDPAEAEGAPSGEADDGQEPPEPPSPEIEAEERERRLEQVVSRIRRELGRTLSAARIENPVEAIYVCGWEVPNLIGTTLDEVPVYELDVFEADSGQPAEGTAPLVVAYGVALRQLGGGRIASHLRREELRFTGTLERIELPLAVAGLMLTTLLGVFVIFEQKLYQKRAQDVDLWLQSAVNFMYGDPKKGTARNLEYPWDTIKSYVEKIREAPEQLEHTKEEQLGQLQRMIELEVRKLDEDLGNDLGSDSGLGQPQSAFEALTLVVGVIGELGPEAGRVAIRKASSRTLTGSGTGKESVEVQLDLSFFADNVVEATGHYEAFRGALDGKPWVSEVAARGTSEFEDGLGVYTDGMRIVCDLSLLQPVAAAEEGQG
jgi:Tfp pilus assembly PilM family ATPase